MQKNLLDANQREWLKGRIQFLVDRKLTMPAMVAELSRWISKLAQELIEGSDAFDLAVEDAVLERAQELTKTIARERDEEISKALVLRDEVREAKQAFEELEARCNEDGELAGAVRILFQELVGMLDVA